MPDGERVILVTGAGHRVGRALALGVARAGWRVAVHYHASAEPAAETVRLIRDGGGSAGALGADLSGPTAPAALVREVARTFGRLDAVVNSASIMEAMPLGEVTAERWDAVMNLNLRAPFLIAQEAARHLPEGGSIINIADLAAFETWARFVPHGVSKAGLVYVTRALASLLAPRIRVNGVAPGTVLLPEWIDPATADRWAATTPLRRHGTPEDVVRAVLYLLDATYMTGETIIVDGGRHVRR
jgi:pteridine reductase